MLQDEVYQDILACGDVTQLAMLDDKCIGAIGCRLQRVRRGEDTAMLYILTLGVLAPFRNQGIGRSFCQSTCSLSIQCTCRRCDDETQQHSPHDPRP